MNIPEYITLFAVFCAFYLGSSFHESRKQKKLKLLGFKSRIECIYKDMMIIFLDHLRTDKDCKIQDYIEWNPNSRDIHYKNFSTDTNNHHNEIAFLEFLKEKNIITDYYWDANANEKFVFLYYNYVLCPAPKSWDYIERQYNKSPAKIRKDKFGKELYLCFNPAPEKIDPIKFYI